MRVNRYLLIGPHLGGLTNNNAQLAGTAGSQSGIWGAVGIQVALELPLLPTILRTSFLYYSIQGLSGKSFDSYMLQFQIAIPRFDPKINYDDDENPSQGGSSKEAPSSLSASAPNAKENDQSAEPPAPPNNKATEKDADDILSKDLTDTKDLNQSKDVVAGKDIAPPPIDTTTTTTTTIPPVSPKPTTTTTLQTTTSTTTPKPEKSLKGNASRVNIILKTQLVNFGSGQSHLTKGPKNIISRVALYLIQHAHEWQWLSITGHTDNRGTGRVNLELSQARAKSVRLWLEHEGVAAAKLKSAGFGSTKPLDKSNSAVAREKNRRVELEFSGVLNPKEFQSGLFKYISQK